MILKPGDLVERYQVEAMLGSGAMAEVYRVRHRTLGTLHALKVLILANARIRERLILEGQVQARMRHPNVLAVTDVLDVDGVPGLLMEFVDGPTLHDVIQGGPLSSTEAGALFRGVLAGVAEAHGLGLVHRDLKPANVLVATTPRGRVPKVADFGLAKLLSDAQPDAPHLTRSGTAMGTPAYMAPEQIRNARRVDHRADIFSLGCILYELMSGRRAFEGDDVLALFNAVASGAYSPLPNLPDSTQRAIQGALEVSVVRRIPNCEVLLAVFEGAQSEWQGLPPPEAEPALAPPQSAPAQALGTWSDADDPPEETSGDGASLQARVAPRPHLPPSLTYADAEADAVTTGPRPTHVPPSSIVTHPSSMESIEAAPGPAASGSERASMGVEVRVASRQDEVYAPAPATTGPRPRPWALAGGVLAGLAVLVGLYWRGSTPDESGDYAESPGVIDVPGPAGVGAVATPQGGGASAAVPVAPAATPVPPAAPSPVQGVAAPAPRAVSTPTADPARAAVVAAPAAAPSAATASASPAAPVATASLVVTCPGATVSIDGKPQPKKGMARADVSVGTHRVSCQGEGAPISRDVVVTAGEGGYFCWDFDVGAPCT